MKSIRPEELKKIINQKNDNYFILDVRTIEEHKERNIGGLNIPLHELSNKINSVDINKEIITYCKSGGRSAKACEILLEAGAKSVHNLVGGITAFLALP